MLLISALALGLVESTSPHAGAGLGYSVGSSVSNSVGVASGTGGNSEAIIASHSAASQSLSAAIVRGINEGGSSSASGTLSWDTNGTFKTAGPGEWSIEQCLNWHRPHHLYYQLSNAFFFLAFMAPHSPFGMMWLRSIVIVGCVLMAMWGWLVECTPDIVLWSFLFLIVNVIYLIVLLVRLRPIRFDKELEAVYESLFKPLRVSRHQFKKILSCMKLVRSLKYQEVYAQEKVTKVDSLSLVLSGKLVVSQNQRALHIVFSHQFLDSPEWFGVSTDEYFQVSITAMEESRVLIWHRDKLKLTIIAEPFLQAVFDHVLGKDVVKKLMQVTQVTETIASNGFLPPSYEDEENPMLHVKKSNDGHGLTALINRQLQEEHAPLLSQPRPKHPQLVIAQKTAAKRNGASNSKTTCC